MVTKSINQFGLEIKQHKSMFFITNKKIKLSEFTENSITFKA